MNFDLVFLIISSAKISTACHLPDDRYMNKQNKITICHILTKSISRKNK